MLNNIIKTTMSSKNRNKIMTLGYAVIVAAAFVISLANNSDVNASISRKNDFDYMELKSKIDNNFIISNPLNQDISANNIISLFGKINVIGDEKKDNVVELEVKSGDTFIKMLTSNFEIGYSEANKIAASLKGVYNVGSMRIGQKIYVTVIKTPKPIDDAEETPQFDIDIKSMVIRLAADQRVIVEKSEEGEYLARTEKDEIIEEVNVALGTIDGSLSVSMNNAGVPKSIVTEFVNIFAFSIDFRRDVHKGDKFEIIYENYINNDGELIRTGNILYASLYLRKDKISLYRYKMANGDVDYFNEKGYPMKKTLHRKPLNYPNARISSHFGKRRHPILKQVKIHWGIDYAAPKGTAVFAAGDGVVQMAQWHGGYGKYIRIRHNSEYSTAYGHLNGFAKGIASGTRVKQGQIIGYVGNTGRSTGPHLHYEVIQAGRRVNPLNIKASAAENIKGNDFTKFKQTMAAIQAAHPTLFADKVIEEKVAVNVADPNKEAAVAKVEATAGENVEAATRVE